MPLSRSFTKKDGETITVTVDNSERVPCEIYSRIVGYYRPTYDWNVARKAEWAARKFYNPPAITDVQPTLPIE